MDASTLILPAILVLTALALVMSGIAIVFQIRRDRLPDATRFENIRELRAQEERVLAERRQELSIVEQKIQQRDRLIAEVAGLEERLGTIKAELSSLDIARQEIEEVKADAANKAAELAKVLQDLEAKRTELAQVMNDLDPSRIDAMKREFEQLTRENNEIQATLSAVKAERDAALKHIEEARSFQASKAALQLELDTLNKKIADLNEKQKVVENLKAEITLRQIERENLQEEIARLAQRAKNLEGSAGGGEGVSKEDLIADLIKAPACLASPGRSQRAPRPELEALQSVASYLKAHGLEYSRRIVHAFHTSLKINDNSQLTVLAGVSGTGKSLLPRRYSEAMGIHFLQIAVEPRWDSPQDLLGFYNYVENKYRATELSRLLVHLDPYTELAPVRHEQKDRMALVLLDEMNLARVEYYFSEFLSRLEARPRYQEADDGVKRKDAMIPIDIRGGKQSVSLFPAHNILFAGTMNDDESTQALSDKVLDRGNIIQFAAPREFHQPQVQQNVSRPDEAQSFKSWRNWIRRSEQMSRTDRETADQVIGKLAEIMEGCGRPFGHRLRDSILVYAANYPSPTTGAIDVRDPLSDQIEFRIMPKLRGLQIDGHQTQFDQLEYLLRHDLNDGIFSDRIAELREKQGEGTGLFVWRGLSRDG